MATTRGVRRLSTSATWRRYRQPPPSEARTERSETVRERTDQPLTMREPAPAMQPAAPEQQATAQQQAAPQRQAPPSVQAPVVAARETGPVSAAPAKATP